MGTYIYNPNICPWMFGLNTMPGNNYSVVKPEVALAIKDSHIPVITENDPNFQPLWVENIPARTPDQIP